MIAGNMLAVALNFLHYLGTTQINRAAIVLAFALIGIGIGVGFSTELDNVKKLAAEDETRRQSIFSDWQMAFTTRITEASSLSMTIAAFASAIVDTPMNLSLPTAQRMKVVNPDGYERLCKSIIFDGITTLILMPGFVVTQLYPPGSGNIGSNLYPFYSRVMDKVVATGKPVANGPAKMSSRVNGFAITVVSPIYVNDNKTIENMWGVTMAGMEMGDMLNSLDVDYLVRDHGLDYALWFSNANDKQPTIIKTNSNESEIVEAVMTHGMRMPITLTGDGSSAFFAMHPRGGPVSATIQSSMAAMITLVVLALTAFILACVYAVAFVLFLFRHRHAPSDGSEMFIAALTLRGAQPIADRAPLEAVRMFNDFVSSIQEGAKRTGCYPVCEVGDRTVYVVAKTPTAVMALVRHSVFDIAISGNVVTDAATDAGRTRDDVSEKPTAGQRSINHSRTTSVARTRESRSRTRCAADLTSASHSSFIGTAICRPSAAIHTATARCVYDAVKDRYFFGNAAQLGKLCGALDATKGGEVGWTVNVEEKCSEECRKLESASVSNHIVSEGNDVTLHIASLWKETGDERDNEDPSVAMAALSDAYVKKMTVIVSEGRQTAMSEKKKRSAASESTDKGSSNKSADATAVTRNATILHMAILEGARMPLDIIRRIVAEEKGAVVSGHENVLVVAFNLLSPGGHHQVRAADTVLRLRAALPDTPFVCSLHHGKVNALIIDGLVLCSGDAVHAGRLLLDKAVALRTQTAERAQFSLSALMDRPVITLNEDGPAADDKGLCLLYAVSELSSTYECEAVDVVQNTVANSDGAKETKLKVVYRLAHRKSGKGNDDEWMYRLKDEEDQSPFAAVNAVFNRVATGDIAEAALIWAKVKNDRSTLCEISILAQVSIENHLPKQLQERNN